MSEEEMLELAELSVTEMRQKYPNNPEAHHSRMVIRRRLAQRKFRARLATEAICRDDADIERVRDAVHGSAALRDAILAMVSA